MHQLAIVASCKKNKQKKQEKKRIISLEIGGYNIFTSATTDCSRPCKIKPQETLIIFTLHVHA